MSRSASNNRWGIASRVLAALVGGYAVAYAVTASRGLSAAGASDRVVFSSLASFAVWAAVVIYVFAARSAGRIWLPIIGVTAVLCLAAFLSGDWRVRP